jgi:DNA gyrase subunit A
MPDDEVMTVTKQGMMVRCPPDEIRQTGRSAQGVRLISLSAGDEVTSVAIVVAKEDEE